MKVKIKLRQTDNNNSEKSFKERAGGRGSRVEGEQDRREKRRVT